MFTYVRYPFFLMSEQYESGNISHTDTITLHDALQHSISLLVYVIKSMFR
jgi:hypothetical protein